MPLYEYRCQSCGETIEVIQKFSDKPKTRCEACGGRLEKLLSASGFVLKGSGWYKTDYAGSSKPKPSGAATEGGGSKDAGSTDSGSKDAGSKDAGSKKGKALAGSAAD